MPGWMPSCLRAHSDDDEDKMSKTGSAVDSHQGDQNGRSQLSIPEEVRAYTIVELEKKPGTGFGLTVSGGVDKDGPPRASNMRAGGVAQRSDLLTIDDRITAVNGIKTSKLKHEDVINLLKNAGENVSLEIQYEIPPAVPNNSTVASKNVEIRLPKENGSFGFTLRGGLNSNPNKTRPLTITHIRPGGPADREGTLKVGDRISALDSFSLASVTHMEAMSAVKQSGTDATFRVDYEVSIMEAVQNATGPLLIEVAKSPGANLGVTLSSIMRSAKLVLVIDAIRPASIADRCGALHIGDEILSIDNNNTSHMSVPEATQLLATASEQIKFEILPVSHIAPRLTYPRDNRSQSATAPRSVTPMSQLNNTSYNSLSRSQGMLHNTRQQPSTLSRKLKAKIPKSSSTLSLASTINGIGTTTHVCRCEAVEVTLYSRSGDFGFGLQGGVFTTEILGSPALVGYIEPGGKADKCGIMQVGDRVVAINNRYTDELTLEEAHQILRDSGQQCSLFLEFDVAESVVPTSGVFSIKLPIGDHGLGITLSAPKNRTTGESLLISDIKKGSVAHRTGTLEPGDHLLAIDDIHLESFSVEEAAHILRQTDDIVKLRVKKDEIYSEDPEVSGTISFTVELIRRGGPLGITISGTEESFDPIVISALTEGGLAERTGALHIGDRILAINGTSLRGKTLSQAIRHLQNAGNIVTVKISKQDKVSAVRVQDKAVVEVNDSVRFPANSHHFHPVPSDNPAAHSTPIGLTVQGSGDSWEGSGMDTGYHSTQTRTSRTNSPSNNNRRANNSNASPNRRAPRQRRTRSLSQSTSPNDASEDELNGTGYRYGSYSDPMSSDQEDGYRYNRLTKSSSRKSSLTTASQDFARNTNCNGTSPESSLIHMSGYTQRSPQSLQHANNAQYSGYNGTAPEIGFKDLLLDAVTTSLTEELHRVALFKDSDVEDFGFSVSDGVYEPGVYINTIRPGGPATRSGNVRPFDRILQINQMKTRDFDCCMVVPLIAESGNQLELLLSRSPLTNGINPDNAAGERQPPTGNDQQYESPSENHGSQLTL